MPTTHKLSPEAVPTFLAAGKALLTLSNTKSGAHHTYKIQAPGKTAVAREQASVLFVSVLTGPENTTHYSYIGILIRQTGEFKLTAKSKLSAEDKRVAGFQWLTRSVRKLGDFPHVECRHHNHCGKCGRTLTVPESIDSGIGPICNGRLS
jgi:hypothetical protein